jgi:5-methyltetrahydropteroyltriglutamate--homocysteine methyltransferase
VTETVQKQVASGVDIVSDGEQSKISYATYIKDRITGFEGDSPRRTPKDLELFPNYGAFASRSGGVPEYKRPKCVGPIEVKSMDPLNEDLSCFAEALKASSPAGAFMNAASPGVIALFQPNEYYVNDDEYLEALAEAMRVEYEGIVNAGYQLQLDSPDLGLGRHMMFKDTEDDEYMTRIARHVEVLNHATRNIAPEQMRMHICWGNYEGPHVCDVGLEVILPTVLKARPAALLFETANPRHGHEWQVIRDHADLISEEKILVPGVIDSTSNFVEHPELVAERIERFANIVGRERVIAGTDCGFSTFAGFGSVQTDVVWAKLKTLADGAELASSRLWGGK